MINRAPIPSPKIRSHGQRSQGCRRDRPAIDLDRQIAKKNVADDGFTLQCHQRNHDETISIEALNEFRFVVTTKYGAVERHDSGAMVVSLIDDSGHPAAQWLASQSFPAAP